VKRQGIYIIMYINLGAYLQKYQIGLDLGNPLDPGGFLEDSQDKRTKQDYRVYQGANSKKTEVSFFLRPADREATDHWWLLRLDDLGARVDGAGCRGEGGDRKRGLTGGGGQREAPVFEEGRSLAGRQLGLQAGTVLWCSPAAGRS
jgi:hypothetical protein